MRLRLDRGAKIDAKSHDCATAQSLAQSRKTGVPLPGLHSALFAPDFAPAITTGVTAMTATALELLKK